MTFAESLRCARLEAGLTKAELARRSGLTEKTIQRLETGAGGVPVLKTAVGLCNGLGLSMAALLELGIADAG